MTRKQVIDSVFVIVLAVGTCAAHDLVPGGRSFAIGVGVALAFAMGQLRGEKR